MGPGSRKPLDRSNPLNNAFALQDLLGAAIAFILFGLIFVVPGYVTGWLLDLFDFRQRTAAARYIIAMVISMAISPILAFLAYRLASTSVVFVMLALFTVVFIAILARGKQAATPDEVKKRVRVALLVAAGWSAFAILSVTDLQWGNRLYYSTVSYDFTTRVALINAISRTGVPPANASWFPGHPVPLTYVYYFWYIPCSLVEQLGGALVDAHAAMVASVAWCGLTLMSVVALYLRIRNPQGGDMAWKNALLGSGLILVSGLDIIPVLARVSELVAFHGDIEHWNEQITAWIGAISWVPHHVAAVAACLCGVLLVQWMRNKNLATQLKAGVVAALGFASGIGLSVFVTLVFVLFWGIWTVVLFLQRERRLSLVMVGSGVLAVVAASPFLLGLLGAGGSPGSASTPLALAVRTFTPIEPLIAGYPQVIVNVLLFLLLPINYLIELGFFFVVALFWAQGHGRGQWKQNPFHVAEVILLAVVVVFCSFVRSTVIDSNDLGWRAWLPGQFVLLIWGVDVMKTIFPDGLKSTVFGTRQSRILGTEIKALLLIGLITTVADVAALRNWSILEDRGIANAFIRACVDTQKGQRTFAARQAYDWVNANTPGSIVVQSNPADLLNLPIGIYLNRQMSVSGHTAYGLAADELNARADAVSSIFRANNWEQIDSNCEKYYIDLIAVTDRDPMWESLHALEKVRSPLYHNNYYAVFSCGTQASAMAAP